jgi:hypothetical protein
MNNTRPMLTASGPVVDHHTPVRLAAQRLRNTLRLNSVTSGLGGAFAVAAPTVLDGWLDTGRAGWVRAIGAGLVLFAGMVFVVAGTRMSRLLRWTPFIVAGDLAWVVASAATIAVGTYSTVGTVVIGGVAAMVAVFAVRQAITWRSTRATAATGCPDESPPIEVFHSERAVSASPARAWEVITDHDLYGRLAPNLSRVHATTGDGPGLQRSCTNRAGDTWHETCTLWDDHHRFDVAVDTTNYPYPLEEMRGSWSVTPRTIDPDSTLLGMDFRYRPRSGLRGRVFAAAMQAAFPVVLRRILSGWQRHL